MTDFEWVAVALVAITSAARITRLVTHDAFPPAVWVRMKWDDLTTSKGKPSGWNLLLHCAYCFSFWATVAVVAWGYLSDFDTAWWIVNSIFGGSYLAAIVMVHDGDD